MNTYQDKYNPKYLVKSNVTNNDLDKQRIKNDQFLEKILEYYKTAVTRLNWKKYYTVKFFFFFSHNLIFIYHKLHYLKSFFLLIVYSLKQK